ncbi:hypothetical protein A9Z42_0054570 [Trichoderma parareesei]|uniref:BTB domain-containing protein n=1 Tax=Trichoderma parareesei TaxID=858221 RepID=A0A2H2ZNV1_TRIPA|nr:hypothetical protein A9Z42_0054570 [Trichoderma parareesei]
MCDLEIVCAGQTIRVHKLVEASGRYEMKDCEFASVQRMVDFFYNGDYDAKASDETESSEEMLIHVAMFTLADKYIIDGLRTLSQIKFKAAVTKQEKPSVMPQYVKLVYDLECESSKRLRDVVVEAVRLRVAALPSDSDVKKTLEGLMDDIPDFAKDLAMSYIEKPQYTTGLGDYEKPAKPTTTAPNFPRASPWGLAEAARRKRGLVR